MKATLQRYAQLAYHIAQNACVCVAMCGFAFYVLTADSCRKAREV